MGLRRHAQPAGGVTHLALLTSCILCPFEPCVQLSQYIIFCRYHHKQHIGRVLGTVLHARQRPLRQLCNFAADAELMSAAFQGLFNAVEARASVQAVEITSNKIEVECQDSLSWKTYSSWICGFVGEFCLTSEELFKERPDVVGSASFWAGHLDASDALGQERVDPRINGGMTQVFNPLPEFNTSVSNFKMNLLKVWSVDPEYHGLSTSFFSRWNARSTSLAVQQWQEG